MPLICQHCSRPTRTVFQQEGGDVNGQLWCKPCHEARKYSGRFDIATFIQPDTYPGGPITLENYGATPVTFYSESERQAYMQKHELHLKERWCPFPGTDRDPAGVCNPEGYVDQVTLDNRAELFLRAHTAKKEEDIPVRLFSGHLTGRDAEAVVSGSDPVRAARVGRRSNG